MMSKSSMIPALTSCLKLHDIKGFQNGAQKMQLLYCTNIIVKFCEGTVIVVTDICYFKVYSPTTNICIHSILIDLLFEVAVVVLLFYSEE